MYSRSVIVPPPWFAGAIVPSIPNATCANDARSSGRRVIVPRILPSLPLSFFLQTGAVRRTCSAFFFCTTSTSCSVPASLAPWAAMVAGGGTTCHRRAAGLSCSTPHCVEQPMLRAYISRSLYLSLSLSISFSIASPVFSLRLASLCR